MTRDELLVIAAAAAAFVIINIIMWSIIAKKERKAKGIAASQDAIAENTVSSVPAAEGFELIDNIVIVHTMDRII